MEKNRKRTPRQRPLRPGQSDPAHRAAEPPANEREPGRDPARADGLGPYEARYDVSLGYSHGRAILLP